MTGICPEHDRWYEGRLECSGARIRAWIDGRPAADVVDHTFATGRVGLMGLVTAGRGTPHFADFEVEGTEVGPSPWEGLTPPPQHWITPCREVDPETFQAYPNIVQSNSGTLNVSMPFRDPGSRGVSKRTVVVRSTDGGRTWSDPEPYRGVGEGFGACFVRRDGTWVSVRTEEGQQRPEQALYTVESRDEGNIWSEPKTLEIKGEWPEDFSLPGGPSGQVLRLRDGAIILPVMCRVGNVSTNFVFRSDDDGKTWSAPVRCDSNNRLPGPVIASRPPGEVPRWFCPADFSEIGLAEARDNVILGYGRPGPWPYMWQVQSNDGGKTWEPAAFGPFPGYCISLTRTTSGALVAVHRFPYVTANVSYDGGLTWDPGTIIDYPLWTNHKALEVEPDVVLVLYMGHCVEPGQADNRVLRLRVTGGGLVVEK